MLKLIIGGYGTPEFRGENFHGWLYNHEIRETFLPRMFSPIPYTNISMLSRFILYIVHVHVYDAHRETRLTL